MTPYVHVGISLGAMPSPTALAGLPTISDPVGNPSSLVIGLDAHTTMTSSGLSPTTSVQPAPGAGSSPLPSSSTGVATVNTISGSNMINLVPLAASRAPPPMAGVYIGESLPPVPTKLASKILHWEYVEMAEMLPECWSGAKLEEEDTKRPPPRRPQQVTDIFTWIHCYTSYVSVLASRYQGVVPQLMAYLVTITRVSQDFSGLARVRYDAAFRRQAAITGNRKWSQINPSLYSICFTGCAQVLKRCELCVSSTHTTNQCALAADPDPELPTRLKAVESAVVSLATQHQNTHRVYRPMSTEICRLCNDNQCRFPKCCYRHACLKCNGDHPASSCLQGSKTPGPSSASLSTAINHREAARPY